MKSQIVGCDSASAIFEESIAPGKAPAYHEEFSLNSDQRNGLLLSVIYLREPEASPEA